jgi:sugar/nucleoside kinase (ribokinase family)
VRRQHGIALHRLGVRSTLVACVGDDRLGSVLSGLMREAILDDAARLVIAAGEPTSCNLIFNRPGQDRSIEHFPGVNDTFVADDVPPELLRTATLLHVGYPPLMAALVADDGRELGRLLARARGSGVATSLDMANANLDPGEGRVRWRQLLEKVLPGVDVFLPNLAEACHLLGRRVHRDDQGARTLESVARLADELIGLGAGVAGVKLASTALRPHRIDSPHRSRLHRPAVDLGRPRALLQRVRVPRRRDPRRRGRDDRGIPVRAADGDAGRRGRHRRLCRRRVEHTGG